MHKRSLVLLSALMIALCASPLHAGQPSGKHTVKKSKTVGKKRTSTTTKTAPTASDQTTISPGGSLNSGTQTSYNRNKGPRRPAPPKKKKP